MLKNFPAFDMIICTLGLLESFDIYLECTINLSEHYKKVERIKGKETKKN
jgi:hypothetical protein